MTEAVIPVANQEVRAAFARLSAAGFADRQVNAWFGVPQVTDVRFVRPRPDRPRRGLGGWIALFVAGEAVEAAGLDGDLAALETAGWLAREGDRVRARVKLLPLFGLLLASDAQPGEQAVGAPDVSALNTAACLPQRLSGAVLDVGCGAGLISLLAARAGGRVIGSDVDARALAFARLNADVNGVNIRVAEGDLFGTERGPFALIVFNAPLLRAPLAADPGAAPRYLTSPRGEALALEFVRGLEERLAPDGEALLHAQLTPALEEALAALSAQGRATVSLPFAEAPDGTPHALTSIRPGRGRRVLLTPLTSLLPHLRRELLDAAHAPTALSPDATPLPAPWLVLRDERQLGGRWRETHFGAARIDDEDRALLEALDGRALGELSVDEERLRELIERGLVIVR
jgi:methylase of polypeptide subunit release factors